MSMRKAASKAEATVTATEANRHFSALLRRARAGETIAITDRGTIVARIEPAKDAGNEEAERARRLKIWEETEARLRSQPALNLGKFNRDWAYDD
jgi:prevent-host-death family protein